MKRILIATLVLAGCLPSDDRPEPGSILVTGEPSATIRDGFTTSDGWGVVFERFVLSLGDIRLHDPEQQREVCNPYGETRYSWLRDFTVAGREKIGLAYGLGTCSVEFEMGAPSFDAILSAGVTEADREAMRIRDSDPVVTDERTAVRVAGTATRENVSKRFDWLFRRSFEFSECPDGSGGFTSQLEIDGGDALELHVVVIGDTLFQQQPEDDAPHLFQAIADGDADGDGHVTLEELADVMVELPDEDGETIGLLELVYAVQLPRLARFVGGESCEGEVDRH